MLVTTLPFGLAPPVSRAPRTPGIHVSRIIRAIAIESKILKAEYAEELSLEDASVEGWWERLKPEDQLRISIGLAWEEWYIPHLGFVTDHPGEMEVDGVYMTHDGESLDVLMVERQQQTVLALHEVKATYKSIKTVGDLSTQWMWLTQMKAYCKGLKTLVAYLHVLFLCGDYSRPIVPQLRVFKVVFTQQEIEDTWELLTSYVRHRQTVEREELMKDTEDAR